MSTAASVPSCETAVNAAPGSSAEEDPGHDPQVRRRGDRQELRQPLHEPQDDDLEPTHAADRPVREDHSAAGVQVTACDRTGGPRSGEGVADHGGRAACHLDLRLRGVQRRRVGGSGLQVSRIGLGTMTWGDDTDGDAAADQLGCSSSPAARW